MNIPNLVLHFCDAVWEYRVSTSEVFFHHDTMDPALCGQWMPYDTVDRHYQAEHVYPLDLAIWQQYLTPEAIRRFYAGTEEEAHFYLRLQNTGKGLEWHEVYLEKLKEDRLILASRDTQEMQRSSAIAKAVVPEFDYVCRIDLTSGSYVLYYSDENKTLVPQSASDNYKQILEEFNRLYVIPEEADALTEQMRLDRVQQELKHSGEYILYATMHDKANISYKKLRFSYEDEGKKHLLLTRTDVGALMGERKLREREQAKRLAYLENMPVAFCSIKVLLDGNDRPRDFQFTYCNRAHEELEGVQPGELLGKNFYEFFQDTDPKWLRYYYETAYQGIPHVIRSYSPEIQKHLLIYTFQLEPGHCECVLLDETEQQFLFQELEHSRETMKRVLELTTDQVFQYLPERGEVILDGRGNGARQVLSGESLHQVLIQKELLHPDYWTELESAFLRIKGGEHAASIVVQGGRLREGDWKWFRVTMFDFQDGYTHERKVLGFLQNIDEFRSREEALRKKAEQDSLTGVLNAGEGKQRISNILERQLVDAHACHAMFVMDLDDFKGVNDTLGHMAGDQMLTAFARILRQTFRAEDVIYRLGGDEFVVFVEKLHDAEQSVQAILNRLIGHVEEAREEHPLLACSVGVLLTNQKRSFEACYQMADQALYKAKRSGKGRFHITTDVSDQQTLPDAKQ